MREPERKQPSFDLRAHLACDPGTLVFLSTAFAFSSALFSAVELGVFDALERRASTRAELAEALGLPTDALDRLLVLLHSLGLLARDGERYRNAAIATQLLTSDSPHSLRAFLLHQQRHMYPLFAHLSDALRTGAPQTQRWSFATPEATDRAGYAALARSPADAQLFLAAMNAMATGVGTVIAQNLDFTPIRTLVDLGGGGGQVVIELCEAVPHLRATLVDGAEACRFAEATIAARGLHERIATREGDFLAELPGDLGPVDAVLLGGVLADWDDAQQRTLLAQAHRLLAPGGVVLVSETLLDEDRTGPVLPALLSLAMLVGTRGRNFTPSEVVELLARAGFAQPRVVSNRALGVRDLVIATRP